MLQLSRQNSSKGATAFEQSDVYRFRALPTISTARLFKILPDRVDGDITYIISQFEQTYALTYHALYYCWVDPNRQGKSGHLVNSLRMAEDPDSYTETAHPRLTLVRCFKGC